MVGCLNVLTMLVGNVHWVQDVNWIKLIVVLTVTSSRAGVHEYEDKVSRIDFPLCDN